MTVKVTQGDVKDTSF